MGICLETEKKNENEEDVEKSASREAWISQNSRYFGYPNSPDVEERFSMQNNVSVKFEKPKIPVIFVLGGPGSGKITHCDNLSEEKRGVIHINMSDLLQQYSMGSEGKNYNELSSKTITEVLMLEMKMSPAAKAYLVSGYPRNMRDVVEYHDKIQTVNGVLLLAWRKNMLERQVEYGAKLGHIVLQFARMELTNFFQNVTPVADYFDQRNMLIVINGERNPAEVYNDFRAAVMRILSLGTFSSTELEKAGIPNGGIVQPSEETPVISLTTSTKAAASNSSSNVREKSELILEPIPNEESNVEANKLPLEDIPGLVFVIGGPGSNKSELCRKILQRIPGWGHISLGLTLREKVTSGQLTLIEAQSLKDVISSGELVDSQIVYKTLDDEIAKRSQFRGIVIDGFPRNLDQMHIFEEKYNQHPLTLLLDCSKLSMGRNRWDDNIKAFRRRLELFAEQTLPMLKVIDTEHRLNTIDGDTEIPEVQEELAIALIDAIQHVEQDLQLMPNSTKGGKNSSLNVGAAALLQDLDDEEEPLPAKPNATMMNGYGPTRSLAAHNRARFDQIAPNANGPMAGPNVVSVPHAKGSSSNTHRIHAQIESYPMDKIN